MTELTKRLKACEKWQYVLESFVDEEGEPDLNHPYMIGNMLRLLNEYYYAFTLENYCPGNWAITADITLKKYYHEADTVGEVLALALLDVLEDE